MKLKLAIFWRSCTPKHTQKIVHEIQAASHLLTNAWIDKDLQIISSECFETSHYSWNPLQKYFDAKSHPLVAQTCVGEIETSICWDWNLKSEIFGPGVWGVGPN